MQKIIVTHFYINPANNLSILKKPAVIQAHEGGMITGVFHVSHNGNIHNAGHSKPFAFVKRVKKSPEQSREFLVEIGKFEN